MAFRTVYDCETGETSHEELTDLESIRLKEAGVAFQERQDRLLQVNQNKELARMVLREVAEDGFTEENFKALANAVLVLLGD